MQDPIHNIAIGFRPQNGDPAQFAMTRRPIPLSHKSNAAPKTKDLLPLKVRSPCRMDAMPRTCMFARTGYTRIRMHKGYPRVRDMPGYAWIRMATKANLWMCMQMNHSAQLREGRFLSRTKAIRDMPGYAWICMATKANAWMCT